MNEEIKGINKYDYALPERIYLCLDTLTAEDIFTAALIFACAERDKRDITWPSITTLTTAYDGMRFVDEPDVLMLGNTHQFNGRPPIHFSDIWFKYRAYLEVNELFYEYFDVVIGWPLREIATGTGMEMDSTGVFITALRIRAAIKAGSFVTKELILEAMVALDNAIGYLSGNRGTRSLYQPFKDTMPVNAITFGLYVPLADPTLHTKVDMIVAGEANVIWALAEKCTCIGRVTLKNNFEVELISLPDYMYNECDRVGCDGKLAIYEKTEKAVAAIFCLEHNLNSTANHPKE